MSAFISYSRANSDFAVRLAKDLKSAGYDIWLDQLDIPTGARWDDEIEIALEACTTFMIVLSPESMQSQNVKDEIGYAIDAGKEILPVKIKSGDIPFRLRRFQYVDFTDKPYEKSLKEIKGLLAITGQLRTSQDAEKKPSGAEAEPITKKVQPVKPASIPQVPKPTAKTLEATSSPVLKRPMSRGLMIGMVALAALAIAGIIIGATRTSKSPVLTPSSGVPVVENPPTEQLIAKATADMTQVFIQTQAGQSEIFLTRFLESNELNNWEHFVNGTGKRNRVNVSQSNDGLVFNLRDQDLHAYYMYKPVIYKDVVIRMKAENLGQNTNNVSMVCRRTGDTWYEFSVTGGGDWYLYNYSAEYGRITNGGTLAIKYGKSINEYEMHCIGDEISLHINEQLVKSVNISPYKNRYMQGQVGLGVSSGDVFPIDIKVIEFEVSKASSGTAAVGSTLTSETAGIANTPLPGAVSPTTREGENLLVSPKDGMIMVFVPEGEFTMGSNQGEANEKPAHTVFLDAFWIDRTEVTNLMFATFLNLQGDQLDVVSEWLDVEDNDLHIHFVDNSWRVDPGFEDHPVIELRWLGASAYCQWRGDGTRLPTEAEWEKAARGTTENLYPWGNEIDCSLANYGECIGGTIKVGSFPSNASPYGALDMTGNVVEWVADWYGHDYYQSSPSSNPVGPDSGQYRLLRGGSWDGYTEYQVRSTFRFTEGPDESKDDAGFRCVLPN